MPWPACSPAKSRPLPNEPSTSGWPVHAGENDIALLANRFGRGRPLRAVSSRDSALAAFARCRSPPACLRLLPAGGHEAPIGADAIKTDLHGSHPFALSLSLSSLALSSGLDASSPRARGPHRPGHAAHSRAVPQEYLLQLVALRPFVPGPMRIFELHSSVRPAPQHEMVMMLARHCFPAPSCPSRGGSNALTDCRRSRVNLVLGVIERRLRHLGPRI